MKMYKYQYTVTGVKNKATAKRKAFFESPQHLRVLVMSWDLEEKLIKYELTEKDELHNYKTKSYDVTPSLKRGKKLEMAHSRGGRIYFVERGSLIKEEG